MRDPERADLDLPVPDSHEHSIQRLEKRESPDLGIETVITECTDDDCPYLRISKREITQTTLADSRQEGSS